MDIDKQFREPCKGYVSPNYPIPDDQEKAETEGKDEFTDPLYENEFDVRITNRIRKIFETEGGMLDRHKIRTGFAHEIPGGKYKQKDSRELAMNRNHLGVETDYLADAVRDPSKRKALYDKIEGYFKEVLNKTQNKYDDRLHKEQFLKYMTQF